MYSLLNDKEIRALCVLPEKVFDQATFDGLQLKSPAMNSVDCYSRELVEQSMRPPTAEELAAWKPMIEGFVPMSVRAESITVDDSLDVCQEGVPMSWSRKLISYGLSSAGYDVRLGVKMQLFTNLHSAVIDPKRPDASMLVDMNVLTDEDGSKYVIMPPNSYALGHTMEYFRIPRDVMVICVGKSTYARSALQVNVTPIEPGFEGDVVIEVANNANSPLKVYLEEGIAQFIFFRCNPCEVSYADRGGKYNLQRGLTLARM
jgi:dCTP deaminase